MLPRGAAPGGRSLGRAPTGGLLVEARRALGARGVLCAGMDTPPRLAPTWGGVALLFLSLLSLRGRGGGVELVEGHLGPILLEGDDVGVEFMSYCKRIIKLGDKVHV